ncbi:MULTISPECIES: hypothetical protein [Providencia]|uniref:hypothetical protein n=1 Tax=Providencia TaxID=586 RepID=UPI00234A2C7A|nr:hypothetical protein [Providencia sp. PROV143]
MVVLRVGNDPFLIMRIGAKNCRIFLYVCVFNPVPDFIKENAFIYKEYYNEITSSNNLIITTYSLSIGVEKMKILEDICSSIAGNAKTRIRDPFIGAFVFSWALCNWNYLFILIWGEGTATKRINDFYHYLSETPIIGLNYLFLIPFLITIFYLLIFPWFSWVINFIRNIIDEKLHNQAISIELNKIKQQNKLNKENLKANPNKQFLAQLVQHDIDKRNEVMEHLKLRTTRLDAKASEARDKSKEQEAERKDAEIALKISSLELEKKNRQAELEKGQFEVNSAKNRAAIASHRFPSVYDFISKIDESLRCDEINVSVKTIGSIVAALFGYESFESLLEDDNFDNEIIDKVEYIYYDDELARRLNLIALDDDSNNEDFSADIIFEHLQMLFEKEPLILITGDSLAEKCLEQFENNPYYVLDDDGTSAAIAESNTIFEDIDDISIDKFYFDSDDGFFVKLLANASGTHYKEEDVAGRTMTISISIKYEILIGKYGLGSSETIDVNGSLDDYDYDDEYEFEYSKSLTTD